MNIDLIVVLSLTTVFFAFLFTVQYIRNGKLENISNILLENMQSISDLISSSSKIFQNERIVEAFRGDDEVGTFFDNLKKIQDILDKFILPESNGGEEK